MSSRRFLSRLAFHSPGNRACSDARRAWSSIAPSRLRARDAVVFNCYNYHRVRRCTLYATKPGRDGRLCRRRRQGADERVAERRGNPGRSCATTAAARLVLSAVRERHGRQTAAVDCPWRLAAVRVGSIRAVDGNSTRAHAHARPQSVARETISDSVKNVCRRVIVPALLRRASRSATVKPYGNAGARV